MPQVKGPISRTVPVKYPTFVDTITSNGDTVVIDVSQASNAVLMCSGTFAGVNCAFEASLDGTTWFGVQAVRTNANTIETTTGALSAAPAYGWELSVNGFNHLRILATAYTSGTQTWKVELGAYATEPVPAIPTHAVTGSGTFTVSGTATTTPAAGTTYDAVTTAGTNAASVKASAGQLFEVTVSNVTATATYVKFYNKASAPTVGTDVPVLTIPCPANSTQTLQFGAIGKRFATGIAVAATAAIAATDTANAVAGVQINATYI